MCRRGRVVGCVTMGRWGGLLVGCGIQVVVVGGGGLVSAVLVLGRGVAWLEIVEGVLRGTVGGWGGVPCVVVSVVALAVGSVVALAVGGGSGAGWRRWVPSRHA